MKHGWNTEGIEGYGGSWNSPLRMGDVCRGARAVGGRSSTTRQFGPLSVRTCLGCAPPVAQAFQRAGSRNFPVPWTSLLSRTGDWKVPSTRRQECLRYGAKQPPPFRVPSVFHPWLNFCYPRRGLAWKSLPSEHAFTRPLPSAGGTAPCPR